MQLDIMHILNEVATPAEMMCIRQDFCESLLLKMHEGDNPARRTFYNAKRIMFTLLYDFMIERMGWRFAFDN
jgi:hypothetical protein